MKFKVKHVDMFETCLPRGWFAKCVIGGRVFHRDMEAETQDMFRYRIMEELQSGVVFHYR